MPDRDPRPAPFPVGLCLRYCGTSRWYADAEGNRPLLEPGMIVTVAETKRGRQGTLRQLRDEDGPMFDDDGEPLLDTTRDGYSVWVQANGNRRMIRPESASEWEVAP